MKLIEDIVLGSEVDDASVNFVSMVEDGDTAEMILEDDSSQPAEPEPFC
jgi:hypothetical protein